MIVVVIVSVTKDCAARRARRGRLPARAVERHLVGGASA